MEYKEFDEVIKDWKNEFPILKDFTKHRLYMVVKPFLLGLRIKMERSYFDKYIYRIYFEIIPLWESILPVSRDNSIVEEWMRSDNRSPGILLSCRRNSIYFKDAVNSIKKYYGDLLKKEININAFVDFMDKYSSNTHDKSFRNSVFYKVLLATALCYNDNRLFDIFYKELYRYIKSRKETLTKRKLKDICILKNGKFLTINTKNNKLLLQECLDYEYKYKLEAILRPFNNRTEFIQKIEENCKLPKVAHLNQGEFVGLDEFVMS